MSTRMLMVAVIALAACKARSQLPLGEECTTDKECDTGLYCVAGLGKTSKCLKACGPNRFGHMDADEDTTCPKGWSCSATMAMTYQDKDGTKKSAFAGFGDRPMCVPDGYTGD